MLANKYVGGRCSHLNQLLWAAQLGGEVVILEKLLVGSLEQTIAVN